jgi:hypothetical protein
MGIGMGYYHGLMNNDLASGFGCASILVDCSNANNLLGTLKSARPYVAHHFWQE